MGVSIRPLDLWARVGGGVCVSETEGVLGPTDEDEVEKASAPAYLGGLELVTVDELVVVLCTLRAVGRGRAWLTGISICCALVASAESRRWWWWW